MKKITIRKVGMRNLKTALAVVLCVIVTRFFNLSASIACVAAVITMESTIYNSFTVGKNRIIGTTIGALIGLIMSLISPGNVILIGIGVIITIYICASLNYKRSITIACVVFLAIMVSLTDSNPLLYSIHRLLETLIGIIIAVSVNFLVCPPKLHNKVHCTYTEILKFVHMLSSERYTLDNTEELATLYGYIKEFDSFLNSFVIEYSSYQRSSLVHYEVSLDYFTKVYKHLYIIEDLKNVCKLTEENFEGLKLDMVVPTGAVFSDIEIVYNYHVEKLICLLANLDINDQLIQKDYNDKIKFFKASLN